MPTPQNGQIHSNNSFKCKYIMNEACFFTQTRQLIQDIQNNIFLQKNEGKLQQISLELLVIEIIFAKPISIRN